MIDHLSANEWSELQRSHRSICVSFLCTND